MKSLKYLIYILPLLVSCQEDPMEEIHSGDWQKNREIVEISFDGQIGSTEITRDGDEGYIEFMFDVNQAPLSEVPVAGLVSSYGSGTSVQPGETMDFSDNNTATIVVTPNHGEPMEWTIEVDPFEEPLDGTFAVQDVRVLVDVISENPEWGGYTDDAPIQDYLPESAPEYDNQIEFTFEGLNSEGESYGTFTHNPGPDDAYGEFTNDDEGVDLNDKYRLLPKGEGTWTRSPSDNTLTFTDSEGNTTEAVLEENGGSMNIKFDMEVVTDWDNLWDSMVHISQMTDYFWYEIEAN